MPHPRENRWLLLATAAGYLLIGIEIIIMISPFALYFYSVYGPALHLLASSPLTAWTTEFFLPHMVFPDDSLILSLSYLQLLFIIGLLLFFSAAIPLYFGRFTGRGVVRFGPYSRIRHPQYLFLAISGFGLLLYWPRFIILLFYITMLFVYYLLARNEEWRMKHERPGDYEAYMASTPMFLPGEPGGKVFNVLFGRIRPQWLGLLLCYMVSLVLACTLATGLRFYTVSALQKTEAGGITAVPVFPQEGGKVADLIGRARTFREVSLALQEEHINLAYIFPGDFFLTALVTDEDRRFSTLPLERLPDIAEWHRHRFSGGLGKFFRIFYNFVSTLGSVPTDYSVERIVFVTVTDRSGNPVPRENLFDLGVHRSPALIVDLDATDHKRLLSVIRTSERHKWGTMPMPTF